MPFDSSIASPIGFVTTLVMEVISAFTASTFYCVMNSFNAGISWYFVAWISDVMSVFTKIDQVVSTKNKRITEILVEMHLIEIIKLHCWASKYDECDEILLCIKKT